jgi:hypothetical protein
MGAPKHKSLSGPQMVTPNSSGILSLPTQDHFQLYVYEKEGAAWEY